MADLAIIVLAAIVTSSNQKVYEKLNFSGIIVKTAESHFAWFCNLLQMSWATEKSAVNHSNRPLVYAPMCLYLQCVLIWIVYTEENNRYHQPIMTSQYMR